MAVHCVRVEALLLCFVLRAVRAPEVYKPPGWQVDDQVQEPAGPWCPEELLAG